MSRAFFVNISTMISSLNNSTLSLAANATSGNVTVATENSGGASLTYSWQKTGTNFTINSASSASTTVTGLSTPGNSTLYCNITNQATGVTISSPECLLTWTAVPQNVAISGTVTYNGAAQSYTLTGSPTNPAPSGTPATFIAAGTYVYPTNITSITAGSGYVLGTVSGSFVINRATISGTGSNTSVTYNGSLQSATVITGVSPAGLTPGVDYSGSVTASGIAANTYTSSITGIGNYQGTVLGGNLTIAAASISGTPASSSLVYNGTQQSATVITGVSPAGLTPGVDYSGSITAFGTDAGSYTSSITGIGNYQGTVFGGTFTITRIVITSMTFTLDGIPFTTAQSRTAGTSYTIAVSSIAPNGSQYSPGSLIVSTVGSYSLTSSGTTNWQGSFTSPVLTLTTRSQNVVISGTVTYNGGAQAYTLTGTPATPAPSGSPTTFTAAGTYVYPTNITSITAGSGYTLGTVTGSFVINRASISGTPASPSLVYNGASQNGTVITGVSPAGLTPGVDYSGSVTATGTSAGTYTSSITGIGNYQGTVSGGTFTITRATITAMSFTLNGVSFTTAQSRAAGTSYTIAVSARTPAGATSTPTSTTVSTAGSYSLTSAGTVNYQGSFTSPVLTLTAPTPSGSIAETARNTPTQVVLQATLTNATATGYTWARVSGTTVSIAGSTTLNAQVTAPTNTQPGATTLMRCTITYSGGSVAPTYNVQWGFV
jgi:hypothetical protein